MTSSDGDLQDRLGQSGDGDGNKSRTGPWFLRQCLCHWAFFDDPKTDPCGLHHTSHVTTLAGCPMHWPITAKCSCTPRSDGDPTCTIDRHAEIAELRMARASL